MSRPSHPRRIAFGGTIGALALALATAAAGLTPARAVALELPSGLSQLLAAYGPGTLTRGIATFDAVPTAGQASTLVSLGLSVQRLHQLPLALVYGPVSAMKAAVTTGSANDVYPDTPIEFLDTYSADAMGAAAVRAAGYTGAGMTVAVIDSGCDASHPDGGPARPGLICLSPQVLGSSLRWARERGVTPPVNSARCVEGAQLL